MTNCSKSLARLAALEELLTNKTMGSILAVWMVQAYLNDPCERLVELASVLESQL
jgi:hypothetical protein